MNDFNDWRAKSVQYGQESLETAWQDVWSNFRLDWDGPFPSGVLRINVAPLEEDFSFWLSRALKRERAQAAQYDDLLDELSGIELYWNQSGVEGDDLSYLPLTSIGTCPALLLDRDGVINKDGGYIYRYEDVEFVPHIEELIKFANQLRIKVIVLTNQSGIGRGYYQEDDVIKLHKWMDHELEKKGAKIDAWYYSPFHPESELAHFKKASYTRKPMPGMALIAAKEQNLDLRNSLMIGDKVSDVLAQVDIKTLLIRGNYELGGYRDVFENHLEILKEVKAFFNSP
ncbi:MAG: HAD family hydrolase [Bacteriovoracaceae bacterium]|nr:HAD family hydrolase [Bacteriovoracaceae bacterium]